MYCAGLSDVFSKHGIRYHVYADDTQLYVDFPRNDSAFAIDRICRCVIDVKAWLASRYMLLNKAKTETILFAAPNRMTQPSRLQIDICGSDVRTSANIRDLGVYLDDHTHYSHMRYSIRSITKHSAYKIISVALSLQNACACARHLNTRLRERSIVRDNVNPVTSARDGATGSSACRPLYRPTGPSKHDGGTPRTHWLPIAQRIQLKVLTLMLGAVHNSTPRYVSDRVSIYAPSRSLRSGTQSLAVVPRINLECYGQRAFSCAGPSLWNALPLDLRTEQDPDRFRKDLKTHLFNVAVSK